MMIEILTARYPDFDWANMNMIPIVFMSGTGEYRVIEELWPTDIYPTIPTSDEIKSWVSE
jgi:hypothetical protein